MNCYVVAFDENENHRPSVMLTLPGDTSEEEAVNKGLEFIDRVKGWTAYGPKAIYADNAAEALGKFVANNWDELRR